MTFGRTISGIALTIWALWTALVVYGALTSHSPSASFSGPDVWGILLGSTVIIAAAAYALYWFLDGFRGLK